MHKLCGVTNHVGRSSSGKRGLSLSPPLLRCFCHSKIIPQSASFLALCLDFLVWRFAHFLYPSPKVCQDEISR